MFVNSTETKSSINSIFSISSMVLVSFSRFLSVFSDFLSFFCKRSSFSSSFWSKSMFLYRKRVRRSSLLFIVMISEFILALSRVISMEKFSFFSRSDENFSIKNCCNFLMLTSEICSYYPVNFLVLVIQKIEGFTSPSPHFPFIFFM